MSSVLATPWRPEHPCGCPYPCCEPSAPEPGQGAPPCTFRHTPKEWLELPGGRFEPEHHRPCAPGGTRCGSGQALAPRTAQAQCSRLLPGLIASKSAAVAPTPCSRSAERGGPEGP